MEPNGCVTWIRIGTEGSASRQRHRGMGASYIPKVVTLNGKSSMSRKRTNWVNCEDTGLAGSLNREREKGPVVVKMMLRSL